MSESNRPIAPPALARLGHAELITPDLDGSVAFFNEILGLDLVERDEERAFLRAWGDTEHHTLALSQGARAGVAHIGWRTRHPDDVAAFTSLLREADAMVTNRPAGSERARGDAIHVTTPAGFVYELYYEVEKAARNPLLPTNSGRQWARGISPRRIDHVNLATSDVAAERGWNERVLGFRTHEYATDADGKCRAAWMAVTPLPHDLALSRVDRGCGIHHLAFYVDSASDVLRSAEILSEHGLRADHGPGRHAVSQAICLYVRDPASGHRVEVYSGGYLALDPDWEPIEWTPETYRQWWGPEIVRGPESTMWQPLPW